MNATKKQAMRQALNCLIYVFLKLLLLSRTNQMVNKQRIAQHTKRKYKDRPTLFHPKAVHANSILSIQSRYIFFSLVPLPKMNCIIQHLLPAFKVCKQRLCPETYATANIPNPYLCTLVILCMVHL